MISSCTHTHTHKHAHMSLCCLFIQICECVCLCACVTALSWDVMDEMVWSLTSVQRPTQDGPIYPALHWGLRMLFLVCRDSFILSLSPYFALRPSLFQSAICLSSIHSTPLPLCLFISLLFFPASLDWLSASLKWWSW